MFYYSNVKRFFLSFIKLLKINNNFIFISSINFLFKSFFIFNKKLIKYIYMNNFFNWTDSIFFRGSILTKLKFLIKKLKLKILITFDYNYLFNLLPILSKTNTYIFSSVPTNYNGNWIDYPLFDPIYNSNFHLSFIAFKIGCSVLYNSCGEIGIRAGLKTSSIIRCRFESCHEYLVGFIKKNKTEIWRTTFEGYKFWI